MRPLSACSDWFAGAVTAAKSLPVEIFCERLPWQATNSSEYHVRERFVMTFFREPQHHQMRSHECWINRFIASEPCPEPRRRQNWMGRVCQIHGRWNHMGRPLAPRCIAFRECSFYDSRVQIRIRPALEQASIG